MIKVLLIDDSSVFALGLRMALERNSDLHLAGHVTTSGEAVAWLNAHPEVDVAIVDITLEQQTDGLTLLGILREAFPHVAALVLSHYKIPAYIIQSIIYGARGYLAKDSAPAEIAAAIRSIANGNGVFFGTTLPNKEIIRLFGGEENLNARRPQDLSPKELQVLQLVTSGYSNAQIATALGVATTTVDSYKERIKLKFGLDTLVECVAHAVATHMVEV